MKKISRKIFSLLAASALFAGAFVSCSNGSDSPSTLSPFPPAEQTTTPLSETATVSEVAAVETSGTAAVSGSTATLSANNGTYLLTESTSSSASVSTGISASEAPSTKKGTWKFTESGKTTPKYAGSYTGDISTIGTSNTALNLKVEKILNNGLLTAVVEKKSISMTVPQTGTFDATIPAVKVSSVTSYMSSKMNVQYGSATNYNIYSNN